MGIEQGTSVLDSSVKLPLNTDLIDPRLPRAFKSWTTFRTDYDQQITRIGALSLEEVASLADTLSSSISQAISIENGDDPTICISKEKVTKLNNFISGDGDRIVFMRHGEQSSPEWISSISDPVLRKIRMMQDPFNHEDLLTNKGLVDVFTTAFILLYVKEVTGRQIHVLSSEHNRALEVAEIISVVIPDSTCTTSEGLSCITYRDERDEPPVDMDELLKDIPAGFMPWDSRLVDKWCKTTPSGIRQSEAIINTVKDLVKNGTKKKGNDLFIVLTHSQQLAEVLRKVDRLQNPSIRFPELTMLAINASRNLLILDRGVLTEDPTIQNKGNKMRRILTGLGKGYEWYRIRRTEYENGSKIPFLVSPEPLYLSAQEGQEVLRIGRDVVDFMHATDELYRSEADVKELFDKGKPPSLRQAREARYLFARPDLLMTEKGFSICEIETSPFGLALAELLNRAYRTAGFDTLVADGILRKFFVRNTPPQGTIVYSEKTSSYLGQLQFLAKELMSGGDRRWRVEQAYYAVGKNHLNIYRGFYQYEYVSDLFVNNLVQTLLEEPENSVIPSFTPHMEEKGLLSLIWDRRWEQFLTHQLGVATFQHLREVIPPTWIIGQEQFFAPGLPQGVSSSEGLASLSKSKRKFVLKKSGFGSGSSWAEGVTFLQEKSSERVRTLLIAAVQDTQSLYIVQEFRSSQERPMSYDKDTDTIDHMQARIRLTPYFSMVAGDEGRLIAIKATGCENTNYIHASTGSINTAVAVVQ